VGGCFFAVFSDGNEFFHLHLFEMEGMFQPPDDFFRGIEIVAMSRPQKFF
jgi:hypothetical protein